MSFSLRKCANTFTINSRRFGSIAVLACGLALLPAAAGQSSADEVGDFYEAPFASATGTFEWDVFTATTAAPDVASLGSGTAQLTLTSTPQPMDGPPFALVTSTNNIYTGGTITDFNVALSNLDDSLASTTVVMQVAAIGSFGGFELDGLTPIEFVDRGVAADVQHGAGGELFDTRFYWAEWQINATDELALTFANTVTHQSLAGIRVDYFNSVSPFNADAAASVTAVPEPSSLAVLGLFVGAASLRRRRK